MRNWKKWNSYWTSSNGNFECDKFFHWTRRIHNCWINKWSLQKITLNSRRHQDSLQGYSENSWNRYKFIDNGKHIQLVQKLYTEPNNEDILGSFLQVETTGTDDVAKVPRAVSEPKKRKNKFEVQTKDIRNFFECSSKQTMHQLHKRAHLDQTSKE